MRCSQSSDCSRLDRPRGPVGGFREAADRIHPCFAHSLAQQVHLPAKKDDVETGADGRRAVGCMSQRERSRERETIEDTACSSEEKQGRNPRCRASGGKEKRKHDEVEGGPGAQGGLRLAGTIRRLEIRADTALAGAGDHTVRVRYAGTGPRDQPTSASVSAEGADEARLMPDHLLRTNGHTSISSDEARLHFLHTHPHLDCLPLYELPPEQ